MTKNGHLKWVASDREVIQFGCPNLVLWSLLSTVQGLTEDLLGRAQEEKAQPERAAVGAIGSQPQRGGSGGVVRALPTLAYETAPM